MTDPKLSWVLVGNKICRVDSFANLSPEQRPHATCPVCRGEVVLRIGAVRVPHAAHKPDSTCIATTPDNILHINAKVHLREELLKRKSFGILFPCSNREAGPHNGFYTFAENWDEIQMKYGVDQDHPDLLLLRKGQPVCAIEVFATHSLEPMKDQVMAALPFPWIEVDAIRIVGSPEENIPTWTADAPLPTCSSSLQRQNIHWLCEKCSPQPAQVEEKILLFRVVEFFYPSGKSHRSLFSIRVGMTPGGVPHIHLENESGQVLFESFLLPLETAGLSEIIGGFDEDLIAKKGIWIVDDHMKWHAYDPDNPPAFSDLMTRKNRNEALLPQRYFWLSGQEKWIPDRYSGQLNWNGFIETPEAYLVEVKKYRAALSALKKKPA